MDPAQYWAGYYNPHYLAAYAQAQASTSQPISQQLVARPALPPPAPMGSWYQPGNVRCTYQGCSFTGSHKSVEIHRMDRHLIYPPGWQNKSDWDADPSLKGKSIPIQGTNVILDTPEAIDAWVAERKKRFPTKEHVEDKKRKWEEAVSRGQLDLTDHGVGNNKRRKADRPQPEPRRPQRQRQPPKSKTRQQPAPQKLPDPVSKPEAEPNPTSLEISSDSEDDEPEVVSSKTEIPEVLSKIVVAPLPPAPFAKRVLQPKVPPKNPFASRPTLLRNVRTLFPSGTHPKFILFSFCSLKFESRYPISRRPFISSLTMISCTT